jgi:predicted lipoprotein
MGLGALIVAFVLALVRPWTIRPIDSSSEEAFDAEVYVESIWPRVLQEAEGTAVDVTSLVQGDSSTTRRAFFVRGTGVVSDVNLQSRVGVAYLQIAGLESPGVVIQVGPVIRGTVLRDALEFVRFTDFSNQFDFAAVSSALNSRILAAVLGPIDVESLPGQTVSFIGAVAFGSGRSESVLEITPVTILVGEGRR